MTARAAALAACLAVTLPSIAGAAGEGSFRRAEALAKKAEAARAKGDFAAAEALYWKSLDALPLRESSLHDAAIGGLTLALLAQGRCYEGDRSWRERESVKARRAWQARVGRAYVAAAAEDDAAAAALLDSVIAESHAEKRRSAPHLAPVLELRALVAWKQGDVEKGRALHAKARALRQKPLRIDPIDSAAARINAALEPPASETPNENRVPTWDAVIQKLEELRLMDHPFAAFAFEQKAKAIGRMGRAGQGTPPEALHAVQIAGEIRARNKCRAKAP